MQARIATVRHKLIANPNDLKMRWSLANLYQQTVQNTLWLKELETIVRLDPKSRPGHLGIATAQLALKQISKAEASFRTTARLYPQLPAAWQGLAATLYHQKRYLEAMEAAGKAVRLEPRNANHSYVQAMSALEYAMQFPEPLAQENALRLAKGKLQSLLEVWPDQPDLYFRLGRASIGLRQDTDAIKYLRRTVELAPNNDVAFILLGRVHKRKGDFKATQQVVEKGLVQNPKSPGLHNLLGEVLQSSSDPANVAKSLDSFAKAVDLEPHDALFQKKYGMACLRQSKMEEARLAFEKARELDPNDAFPYQQLAAIYTRLGQPERATEFAKTSTGLVFDDNQLKQIQHLSKLHPDRIPLRLILGDRYRDLGLPNVARDEYLAVLRLDPTSKRARAGLSSLKTASPQKRLND